MKKIKVKFSNILVIIMLFISIYNKIIRHYFPLNDDNEYTVCGKRN